MKSTARKPEPARIQLFLRIKHPQIDPAEITRAFDLIPEHTIQAGPAVSASGVKKLHSESYWLAALPIKSIKELVTFSVHPAESSTQELPRPTRIPSARLAQASGMYDFLIVPWLKKFDGCRSFIKQIVDGAGTITLVLQRRDRNAPLNIGPALLRQLADLEIGLEID